ncbi:septum formation initiator family protein [Larkinella soli]|uniref:septum formation initiator family protein n=1 Tax=Larkinella soli TaxID=1770527 RepID=UPI000FFC2171|nr:septum formation initiator family protein [Larkinella soli]
MLNKFIRLAKNFYVATGVGLLVWMLFFDTNDIISQVRNWWKLQDLETQRIYYREEIQKVEAQQKEILGSPRLQEKYARENYLMRKPTEDVYVLVNEKNEPIEKE